MSAAYWNRVSRMTSEQRQEEALREMVGPAFARLFGAPTPVATRKCRYCGCTESPDTAPDPYTTDGTVEVCPQCNEGESYIAIDPYGCDNPVSQSEEE